MGKADAEAVDGKGRVFGMSPGLGPTALWDLQRGVELGMDFPAALKERGLDGKQASKALSRYRSNPKWIALLQMKLAETGLLDKSVKRLEEALDATVVTSYRGEVYESDVPDHALRARVAGQVLSTLIEMATSEALGPAVQDGLRQVARAIEASEPRQVVNFYIENLRLPDEEERAKLLKDADNPREQGPPDSRDPQG